MRSQSTYARHAALTPPTQTHNDHSGAAQAARVADQVAAHIGGYRAVAAATRPRTVIGIRADVQTRERPRRRVMRHSRQTSLADESS